MHNCIFIIPNLHCRFYNGSFNIVISLLKSKLECRTNCYIQKYMKKVSHKENLESWRTFPSQPKWHKTREIPIVWFCRAKSSLCHLHLWLEVLPHLSWFPESLSVRFSSETHFGRLKAVLEHSERNTDLILHQSASLWPAASPSVETSRHGRPLFYLGRGRILNQFMAQLSLQL